MPRGRKPSNSNQRDTCRGCHGMKGRWIDLHEARECCVGKEDWWTEKGQVCRKIVPVKQYAKNAPSDKPIWLYANGDMYLGEWKEHGPDIKHPVEHGSGITYNNFPTKFKGLVCVGSFQHGWIDGPAESFWLNSSSNWESNHFPASPIVRSYHSKRSPGIPFRYAGIFKKSIKHDPKALVTLKDGTIREGPWENGQPVGGWYSHRLLRAPLTAAVTAATREEQPSESSSESSSHSTKPRARPLPTDPAERKPKKSRATSDLAMTTNETRRGPPTSSLAVARPCSSAKIKQEPPDDNSVCVIDVSDLSTEPVTSTAIPSAVIQHHGSSIGDDIHDDRQDRIHQIRDWMATDVIGNNPSLATMMRYASKLYDIGFELVELIKAHLQPAHIEAVGMARLHQEIVLKRLNDGW